MKCRGEQGSIMLETVLVLPIFVLIVFFIIQITFVWTAKQMTYYAAYCGARAALVYNPADYGSEKRQDGSWSTGGLIRHGVVHHAACTVLAWISWSLGGYDVTGGAGLYYYNQSVFNELMNFKVGSYSIPLSSNIRNQVAVEVREFEKIDDAEEEKKEDGEKVEEAAVDEQFPAVTVRVSFRCPLFIPLGGPVIAYFFGANDQVCIDTREAISAGGFLAQNGDQVHARLKSRGNYVDSGAWKFYNIVLEESCTMAKPYKTDTYPLIPKEDKILMGMVY